MAHVAAGHARLFVREVGDGAPLIAVHGGPDFDHAYLLPELDLLAARFRLICYDQRGRGGSFNGDDPADVTIESEVADLDAVRTRAGDAVTLLGHSWGALLALEYALRHPDRVARLILSSPAPVSAAGARATREFIASRRTPQETQRLAALRADAAWQRGDVDADAEYHRIHFRIAVARLSDVERVVSRLRQRFTPQAIVTARAIEDRLYAETWSRPDYDLLPSISSLRTPTLVLHGAHDLIPLSIAQEIAQAMPAARLQVIANAGHFAYCEQPRAFADAVNAFIG